MYTFKCLLHVSLQPSTTVLLLWIWSGAPGKLKLELCNSLRYWKLSTQINASTCPAVSDFPTCRELRIFNMDPAIPHRFAHKHASLILMGKSIKLLPLLLSAPTRDGSRSNCYPTGSHFCPFGSTGVRSTVELINLVTVFCLEQRVLVLH